MTRHIMIAGLLALVVAAFGAEPVKRVIVYDGVATEVSSKTGESSDLWITTSDLKQATRFEIRPQGVCRDKLCFPLPKARLEAFISKQAKLTWFNLTEFARLIKQPFTVDQKNGIWYFGARSDEQNSYLASLEAPDFTLPDLNGKLHSLSDFRGKKVLLVTWASW